MNKATDSLEKLKKRYKKMVDSRFKIDMTRGKPCAEQLSLSDQMLTNLNHQFVTKEVDYRNYDANLFAGIPGLRTLVAEILNIKQSQVIIGGNSSLNLMYDTIVKAFISRLPDANDKWKDYSKIKFLCPSPGYDRHFSICDALDIEMINVPLTGKGPDMDIVEKLVSKDSQIKGIWCVPQYSNPTGEIYDTETVTRLSNMVTAADDFRIFWDHAYILHHLDFKDYNNVANIIEYCEKAGNPNRVFTFISTSKITYAGSGFSAVASSMENTNWLIKNLKIQTIGYDKINQLRHLLMLPSKNDLINHMKSHAKILRPKFDVVYKTLDRELGSQSSFASWTKPQGGYFISYNTKKSIAKDVVDMSFKAGVKFSPAGSTFPYHFDPKNSNIRIAPSCVSIEDIKKAIEVLSISTKILSLEN